MYLRITEYTAFFTNLNVCVNNLNLKCCSSISFAYFTLYNELHICIWARVKRVDGLVSKLQQWWEISLLRLLLNRMADAANIFRHLLFVQKNLPKLFKVDLLLLLKVAKLWLLFSLSSLVNHINKDILLWISSRFSSNFKSWNINPVVKRIIS